MKEAGEVSAIIGYNKQYEICAVELYQALLDEQLEKVEFASNKYVKLDDVLLINKDRVIAYQVKDIGTNFSYSNFIKSDTISLFEGCFNDWKSLKSEYPNKEIIACYVSNQKPSSHDVIKSFSGENSPSFKQFKQEFWEKLNSKELDMNSISTGWKSTFNELKKISKSTDEELIDFIQSFRFILEDEYIKVQKTFEGSNHQRISDVDKISKQIFSIIGRRGRVTLDRFQVLKEFDLLSRYETHFKHSFFVDEEHYQPIDETISEIDKLISNVSSGYIALIGNAGSGKSTLLTKWIKDRKENVLRYYAYVNKEINNEYGYRGEAEIFLKDLLIQVRENQLSQLENLPSNNIQELQKHLFSELKKLEYKEEKTFIIVDGLDHIEREQNVNRSLIDILPNPNQIPNNIYFILGTRTTENLEGLPDRIKINIQDENRIISIHPFSFTQTKSLIESHNIKLDNEQVQDLHKNTLGHPLFLRYTIEELMSADKSNYNHIISQKDFKGDIYDEYRIFWNKNKNADNFIDILGIISRFRYSYIDLYLLENFITNRFDWDKVQKVSEHYFFKKNNVWQYFHNSFKEFLKEETARNFITNEYDKKRNINYHRTIYESIKDISNEYKFNILYHLFEAEDYQKIVDTASQTYFRKQWYSFRNYKYIFEDIKLSAKASYLAKNPICLFKCFLANVEINQRINIFTPNIYTETFFRLNKIDIANSFIFNATEVFVSKGEVLSYALDLYKSGHIDLALELLKKGEPDFQLNISKEVSPNHYDRNEMTEIDEVSLIVKWVKLSSLFYPLEGIFKRIDSLNIRYDERSQYRKNDRNLLTESIEELTDLYIELQDWGRLKKLVVFVEKTPIDNQFFFYFDIVWELGNSDEFYSECIDKLNNWRSSKINPINKRLALIQVFHLNDIEKGKGYFDLLDSPTEIIKVDNIDKFESSFLLYIFEYSRLFYITSKEFSKSPSFAPIDKKRIVSAYYLEFAELGKSYAYVFYNKKDASKGFFIRFKQIMNYFHYDILDYEYEYSIQNNKSTLINLILKISARISKDFFNSILNEIDKEWNDYSRFWKDGDKQDVIEFVIKADISNEWCIKHLESLDESIFENSDIDSRIKKGASQIKLWSLFNRNVKAEDILNQIMAISVDVRYEKEYQLDYMINWLDKMEGDVTPEFTSYLKSLDSIKYKTSHSSDYLAEQILRFSLDKGNGYELFNYLLFEKFINLNDSLEIVLANLLNKFPENWKLFTKIFSRIVLNCDGSHGSRNDFLKSLLSLELKEKDIKLLANEICINSVSEHRKGYLYKIQEYAESKGFKSENIGIEYDIESKEDSSSSSVLRLKKNKHLTYEEVLEQVNNYKDFEKLFNQEDKSNSYFSWSKIISKKIDILSDLEVTKIISEKNLGTSALVEISKGLYEKNRDSDLVISILNSAIKESSNANWDRGYDGGSKIKAYNILDKIEKKEIVSDMVFSDLADNIEISSNRFLDYADEVFRLIDKDFNYDEYYNLLKEYKEQIINIHIKDDDVPIIIGSISDDEFTKKIILFLSEIPSGFDDILFEILNEEFDRNVLLVKDILEEFFNNEFYDKFIKLLSILSINKIDFVLPYHDKIIELFNSERYDIHSISLKILDKLGIDYKSLFNERVKDIPFIYKMEIPYQPEIVISDEQRMCRLDKTGFLRSTNDPLEFCHLYLDDIKEISKLSGFGVINIAHRIKDLGEKNYVEPVWFKGLSEKEMRDIYEYKFELKIPYKRPQYQKVWCGLMIVLKELWELDIIDRGLADFISNSFDEEIHLIEPIKKPDFIKSIIKDKKGYAPSSDEKWVYELSKEYLVETLIFKGGNDLYILAEYSIIEGQGDGVSSEIRQSFVEAIEQEIDYYYIFNLCTKRYINEYGSIDKDGICLYNWIHTTSKKRNWLAINPKLAKTMNLKLSNEGNFRWLDENENIVVESFYWKSNNEDNRSRNLHSESGQGWYVAITQEGLERIKKLGVNKLYHHRKIFRRLEFTQRSYNTYIKEKNDLSSIEKIELV